MLWRNKNYRLLMAGQTANVIGNQITAFAVFLVVLGITDSPSQAGIISGLFILSMVVCGLPIGRLVDRYPRLATLKLTALVGILGSLLCIWGSLQSSSIVLFIPAAILLGAAASAFGTAERALLKEIVEPELLAKAMAVNQGRYSVGVIVGPPIAGLLLAHSFYAPFGVDALTFVILLGCLFLMKAPSIPAQFPPHTPSMRLAWEWLVKQKQLFAIGWFSPLMNFSFAGLTTTALLALTYHGFTELQLGYYQAAIGVAGLTGAVMAGKLVEKLHTGRMIVWSAILFAMSLSVTVGNYWLVIVGMVAAGFFLPNFNSPCSGYFVKNVPNEFQGRCTAILSTSAMVTMPIGNALAGILFETAGHIISCGLFLAVLFIASCAFIKFGKISTIELTTP